MKGLCAGNYAILVKRMKGETDKWKDTYVRKQEDITLLKGPHYPK